MWLQIYQVDAWAEGDSGWTYNDSFPLKKIYINGEVTEKKLLNALRRNEFIGPIRDYVIDDYYDYQGEYEVQLIKDDYRPIFNCKIIEEGY